MRGLILALAAVVLVSATGCHSMPQWYNPGNIRSQQMRATLHDPYPDTDAGPEVVGGRPLQYQKPLAEPVRDKLFKNGYFGY